MKELLGVGLAFLFSYLCMNYAFNEPSERSLLRRSPGAISLPIVAIILSVLTMYAGIGGLIKALLKLTH